MTVPLQLSCFIVCACVFAARADEPLKPNPPREVKVDGLLTSLTKRCFTMIKLQRSVNDNTKRLHETIEASPQKIASPADLQAAVMLSEFQNTVIAEVVSTINLLEKEGVAVAFPEVFQEVRKELEEIQRRLAAGDVGVKTQDLQQDIIDTLAGMIVALNRRCTKTR